MHTPQGKICAATVTPGKANDSPYLRKMTETVPEGSGDVLADAAYGGIKNCNAICDSGRRAVMECKSNATPKGPDARADMPGFREEHPRTFHNLLRIRNNVESVFSSMKARFGGVVRAPKPHTQAAGGVSNQYIPKTGERSGRHCRILRRPPNSAGPDAGASMPQSSLIATP